MAFSWSRKRKSPYVSLTDSRGHFQRVGVIAVIVVIVIGLGYYLTRPGHGDQVAIPTDLAYMVRRYFEEEKKREVESMIGFSCSEFKWGNRIGKAPDFFLEVRLEIRRARLSEDMAMQTWVVLANKESDGEWKLTALARPLEAGEGSRPCER